MHLDIAFRELLLCTNLLYPTLTFWLHVTVKVFVPMGIVFTNVVKLEERIEIRIPQQYYIRMLAFVALAFCGCQSL